MDAVQPRGEFRAPNLEHGQTERSRRSDNSSQKDALRGLAMTKRVELRITWDPDKAAENLRKHGVSFDDARDIFGDPFRGAVPDDEHSDDEDRYFAVGSTAAGKLLVVFYTHRGDDVRLISARRPTSFERRRYMDEDSMIHDEPMEPGDEETMHLDWSKMVRGLHYIPRVKGTVTLDEDVFSIFRTSEEVNNALRILIKEGRIPHFLSDEEWYAKHEKSRKD